MTAPAPRPTSARWGDYTSMNVDPVDDCTFWYINEYFPATSAQRLEDPHRLVPLPGTAVHPGAGRAAVLRNQGLKTASSYRGGQVRPRGFPSPPRAASPHLAALLRRAHHRRVRRAAERLLELGQVRQRPDDAVLARSGAGRPAPSARCVSGADGVAAELAPGDEELLLGREAVDGRLRALALARLLEGRGRRCLAPARSPIDLAQHQLAVVVDAGLDEVALELVDHALPARLELLEVLVGPPVLRAGPGRRTARPGRRSRG